MIVRRVRVVGVRVVGMRTVAMRTVGMRTVVVKPRQFSANFFVIYIVRLPVVEPSAPQFSTIS